MSSSTVIGACLCSCPISPIHGPGCNDPSPSSSDHSPAMTWNNPAPCLCVEPECVHEKWQVRLRKYRENFRRQRSGAKSLEAVSFQQNMKTERKTAGGLIFRNTKIGNHDEESHGDKRPQVDRRTKANSIDLIDWSSSSSDSSTSSSSEEESNTITSLCYAREHFSILKENDKMCGAQRNQNVNRTFPGDLINNENFGVSTIIGNRIPSERASEETESRIRFTVGNSDKYEFQDLAKTLDSINSSLYRNRNDNKN